MNKRASRWLAALCASFLAVHVSGCFGSFALTRKIYGFNQDVSSNKFVQWLVFLGFTIIPVYGVGAFVDAIVLNSLEFWTGSNPMASAGTAEEGTRVVQLSPTDTLRLSRDGRGVMRVELERAGQAPQVRYFEPLDNGMAVRDEAGALLVRAWERADGAVEVSDASGTAVTVHSRESVAEAHAAFFQEGVTGLARQVSPQGWPLQQGLALTCASR